MTYAELHDIITLIERKVLQSARERGELTDARKVLAKLFSATLGLYLVAIEDAAQPWENCERARHHLRDLAERLGLIEDAPAVLRADGVDADLARLAGL